MSICNYCLLKKYMSKASKKDVNKIVIKRSSFMGGFLVFEIPKEMGDIPKYVEPNKRYPNGDRVYKKYIKAWMGAIPEHCAC